MESIFANVGVRQSEDYNPRDHGEINEYEAKIKALIADAEDYNLSELSPDREDNLLYYYGHAPALGPDPNDPLRGDYEDRVDNRSTVVSTDVRDTVMSIMPSLIRIFTQSENIADFVPSTPEGDDMAKQATCDVLHTFWQDNPGFLLLHTVFKDTLTEKVGVLEWCTDNSKEVREREFQNILPEQVQMMIEEYSVGAEEGSVEVVEDDEVNEAGYIPRVVIRYVESKPRRIIEAVAPEDFRIDRRATTPYNSRLIGSSRVVSVSDVVSKGIPKEVVEDYVANYDYYSVERTIRNPGIDTSVVDRDLVQFGKYFIRIDSDGDGIDELHYVCTLGNNYDIVVDQIVDDVQMAVFMGDPRPHSPIGDAMADLVKDIQEIKTRLLRGALDGLSASMFPDLVVNESLVNMEDVLSDGIGRILRVKADPAAVIKELRATFAGEEIFAMLGNMDMVRQSRTGISEASKGVDPKALQSTNLMGIDAIVTGAQERIELVARILAETGFRDLMKGLLREAVRAPNRKRTFKRNGKWYEYDQSVYDPNLTVEVNPSLGKGSDMTRMTALQQIREAQMMVVQSMGLNNPIVTLEQLMNTMNDMLAMANIKNTSRYWNAVTPEMMQALSGPKEPSAEELIAQAELEKVKAQTAKAISERAFKENKLQLDDDFRRDKLGLDNLVKLVTELAKAKPPTEPEKSIPMGTSVVQSGVSAQ